MSSNTFVFPPPPPPPPTAASPGYTPYSHHGYQQSHGQNNQAFGRGGYARGRGRGDGFRGSRGGGNRGYSGQSPNIVGYNGMGNIGHGPPMNGNAQTTTSGYPLPNYPRVQQNGNPFRGQHSYGQPFQTPHMQQASQNNNQVYNSYTPFTALPHSAQVQHYSYSGQRTQIANMVQPVISGPPIRMGFDDRIPSAKATGSQDFVETPRPNTSVGQQQNTLSQANIVPFHSGRLPISWNSFSSDSHHTPRHHQPNQSHNFRGRGQKRAHSDAFSHERKAIPKAPAPPTVPSFGAALPGVVVLAEGKAKKPRKKSRKHNQLGLTPRAEEHEISEEEDVDEESKLMALHNLGSNSGTQQLQFEHKGQLATLSSPAEIAAWIQERKRRFPTKAKAKEAAEGQRKIREAERAARELRRANEQNQKGNEEKKRRDLNSEAKAKLKAEKLRQQYEKARKHLEKVQSKIRQTQNNKSTEPKKSDTFALKEAIGEFKPEQSPDSHLLNSQVEHPAANVNGEYLSSSQNDDTNDVQVGLTDPLTPTSQPISPANKPSNSNRNIEQGSPTSTGNPSTVPGVKELFGESIDDEKCLNETNSSDSESSISSLSSSDVSKDDDETSSSGSSDDNDQPNEVSSKSKSHAMPRVIKPTNAKGICRLFLQKGRCPRGNQCRYRHELPERGNAHNAMNTKKNRERQREPEKKERISLYQRLVRQEQKQ